VKGPPPQAGGILAEQIAAGRQIVLSTAMVGDRDDFDVWTRRCRDWTVSLERSLTYIYGEDSAATFQRATAAEELPGARWHESLSVEHDRVRGVVDMLDTLITELHSEGSSGDSKHLHGASK